MHEVVLALTLAQDPIQPAAVPAVSAAPAVPVNPDCRIRSEHPKVFATMTTVSIDGDIYPVAGSGSRFAFESMLSDCGMSSAAFAFDRWRAKRRATNIVGISGASASLIPILWPVSIPVLLVTPFEAVAAGNRKGEMVAAISSHK